MSKSPADGKETRRVAIIQSAYVPWRGFFDLINRCDEYVVFDSVQFAKRHWHNRNVLKTAQGPSWITIPVASKSRFEQPIDAVEISEPWAEKHWKSIEANYRKAHCFSSVAPVLQRLYEACSRENLLTNVNEILLRGLLEILDIDTRIVRDSAYEPTGTRTDRLLDICVKAQATHYLSGPSARSYLEEDKFREAGITVEWMDYPDYPIYRQLWGDFTPAVSIIDLLLNEGPARPDLWSGALLGEGA